MVRLEISLLGAPRLRRDRRPVVEPVYDKGWALLAYLALEADRPHRRAALAALLWPDRPAERAHHSLRQAIANLRRALGDRTAERPALLVSRAAVQFNRAGDSWLDVGTFAGFLEACERHAHSAPDRCAPCARRLEQAVALYAGEFLEGVALADSLDFENWVALQRERLHRAALEALSRLAAYHERRGAYERARVVAARQLALEPWREEAHRQVMRALQHGGERAAALAQYERCRRILASELGAEPEPATTALYERIRAGGDPAPPRQSVLSAPAPPLPAPLSSFIGRRREREELAALLTGPSCRLLTLLGPGGVGKTRLALRVAADLRDRFADGVYLASLAPLVDPAMVLPTLARALGLREDGAGRPVERLMAALRGRRVLLLLDGFERVAAAGPALAELLGACPELTALATSRAALHLAGERVYRVQPLPTSGPHNRLRPRDFARGDAVALFVARAADAGFRLTEANAPVVAAICRHLDGLPLAIELAAARSRLFPPQTLLAQLARPLDVLEGGGLNLPARQQTLRGTVRWSYDLLDAGAQRVFRRLAVFEGGCTMRAAEAIGGSGTALSLRALEALIDQSLLHREEDAAGGCRFTMLDTIREYAREQLALSGEEASLRGSHAGYYLQLAARAEPLLVGPDQEVWLERLDADHHNLRAALRWLVDQGDGERALRLAGALWWFWYVRDHRREGVRWLEQALALGDDGGATRCTALNGAGYLARSLGDCRRAARWFRESLALSRRRGGQRDIAAALNGLGCVAADSRGDFGRARTLAQEALALLRTADDRLGVAQTLCFLGRSAAFAGDEAAADPPLEEALGIYRELGHHEGEADALGGLGLAALGRGDEASACSLLRAARAIRQRLGDRAGAARTLSIQGEVALQQHDIAAARQCYQAALATLCEVGGGRWVAWCLEGLAGADALQERDARAARLFGAAAALRGAIKAPRPPAFRWSPERHLAAVKYRLDAATYQRMWADGATMPFAQVLTVALAA